MAKSFSFLFLTLTFVAFILQLGLAQVTLSRSWGPGAGKRATLFSDADCRVNPKSLALVFHTLMTEIKRLMTCDHQATIDYLQAVEH